MLDELFVLQSFSFKYYVSFLSTRIFSPDENVLEDDMLSFVSFLVPLLINDRTFLPKANTV